MRPFYWAAGAILLLSLVLANGNHAAAQRYAGPDYTNISQAINVTAAYLSTVNKSTYLIFSPNMAQPYRYFDQAVNASKTDPSLAYAYLADARQSAEQQQAQIYGYRTDSFWVVLVLFLASFAVLYFLM